MKAAPSFLAGFLVAIGIHAVRAIDLEIAVGRSEFCCLQDGVWWQSPFGFNGNLRAVSAEIGLRQRIGDFGAHLAYVNLGSVSSDNFAAMRDDEFGRHDPVKPCNTANRSNCLGRFIGRQSVQGIIAGASYQRNLFWGIAGEIEAGEFFYKSHWSITIHCPGGCGTDYGLTFATPERYTFGATTKRTHYAALKATYRSAFIVWRRFSRVDGGGDPAGAVVPEFSAGLTNGPVNQIMLGMVI